MRDLFQHELFVGDLVIVGDIWGSIVTTNQLGKVKSSENYVVRIQLLESDLTPTSIMLEITKDNKTLKLIKLFPIHSEVMAYLGENI